MRKLNAIPKNPNSNETQKSHDHLLKQKYLNEAKYYPNYAETFFDTFPKKFCLRPNFCLKKSIVLAALSISNLDIKPDRTQCRYLECIIGFINKNWDVLEPVLNKLSNVETITDDGKIIGYKIAFGSEELWTTNAKGNIPKRDNRRAKKRDLKQEIQELQEEEQNIDLDLEQYGDHSLIQSPSSPEFGIFDSSLNPFPFFS